MKTTNRHIISIILSSLIICLIISGINIHNVKAQKLTSSNDLIADWKLNEGRGNSALDSSGNAYNGIFHGTSWVSNQGINYLEFNGVSSYVDVPSLPVSNIASLTVVAWINSNFSQIGYIFYHGDTGEFLLHNGERTSDGPVAGRYPNIVSFSVKIVGSTWYDVYSSPLQPNTWHQIVGIWEKGTSLRIYVDGVLDGQNTAISSGNLLNDGPTWLPSLGVYNRGAESNTYYKGLLSNVMVFNTALSPQEISGNYVNENPKQLTKPTLDISCDSSTSFSAFKVTIDGSLSSNSIPIADEPIQLSYSVNGGSSWQDLTLSNTDSTGKFSETWTPIVTGNYLIKATYDGNDNYAETSVIVNLAVTSYQDENIFSVSSNSTVSSLSFNSTSKVLSFSVTGPSNTSGYSNVYIAKTLVQDTSYISVYLDENKVDCSTVSTENSWLLHFTYEHSTHGVTVNLATKVTVDEFGNWAIYMCITLITLSTIGIFATRSRNRKQK
jgi:hypothetical protein